MLATSSRVFNNIARVLHKDVLRTEDIVVNCCQDTVQLS